MGGRSCDSMSHVWCSFPSTCVFLCSLLFYHIEGELVLDEVGYYGTNTTYFIPLNDLYLLGLLNSRLGLFYFTKTCAGLEGQTDTYLRFFGQYLEGFPVRLVNASDPLVRSHHDRIKELVKGMLALHKQLKDMRNGQAKAMIQRQTDATDRQIDKLVYELYGLSENEIKVIEGKTIGEGEAEPILANTPTTTYN